MPILIASIHDAPELVQLVNLAYRGPESKRGWTTEADLLTGIRINDQAMRDLLTREDSVILKYTDQQGELKGCVYLEKQDRRLYLGMLSVSPLEQSSGMGSQLLKASEEYAIQQDCSIIGMTVISARTELIAWYERFGYRDTGIRKPFPTDEEFGSPLQALEFIIMEKDLNTTRP